jgi:hypothetical protein
MKKTVGMVAAGVCLGAALTLRPAGVHAQDQKVNDDAGSALHRFPVIAMIAAGPSVVAWEDERRGTRDVYFQLYGRRGAEFGTLGNVRVNDDGTPSAEPVRIALAMDRNGRFTIGWTANTGIGRTHVCLRRFLANGVSRSGIVNAEDAPGDKSSNGIALASDDSGNVVAAWTDRRNDPQGDVFLQAFDPSGRRVNANLLAHTITNGEQCNPAIAMNGRGDGVVLWEDRRNGGTDLYARRFGPGLVPRGAEFQPAESIRSWTAGGFVNYDAVVRPDGTIVFCWVEMNSESETVCRARLYDSTGAAITPALRVGGSDHTGNSMGIRSALDKNGTARIVWADVEAGDFSVYSGYCLKDGTAVTGSHAIGETEGSQVGPDVAADGSGNLVYVWMDNRDGSPDILRSVDGSLDPTAAAAGSGFDSMVPLTWEPYYGQSESDHFSIFRRDPGASGFEYIASVAQPTPWQPNRRFDWIDTTVANGLEYEYRIAAVAGGPTGNSAIVSATPRADGPVLNSAPAVTIPVIDGRFSPGEWDDAALVDISGPDAFRPIRLYVKNSAAFLYLAVDDPNDAFVESATTLGFLMDLNRDRVWDASAPSDEGMVTMTQAASMFTAFWGRYPDGLGAAPAAPAGGIDYLALAGSGHVQHEAAVDLSSSPLKTTAGSTIGFAAWVADPGNFYPTEYGNAGQWPAGTLVTAAKTLGSLTLAAPSTAPERPAGKALTFELGRNYPNPFNPSTVIPFRLAHPGRAKLSVFDVRGREIAVLDDGFHEAGIHSVPFGAGGLPSGVYFVRLRAGESSAVEKIIKMD